MYSLNQNNLVIRFNKINDFTSYLKIIKSLMFIDYKSNIMKKRIEISLDLLVILDKISDACLLYRCVNNFNKTLNLNNLQVSDIDISNIVILYNKLHDKYLILGINFGGATNNLSDLFDKYFGINLNSFIDNLQYLYFIDSLNEEIEQNLSESIFKYDISLACDKIPTNKFLPIITMKTKYSIFLSNALFFIQYNIEKISNSNYIIISKNGFNSHFLDKDYILTIKNYEIIGEKDNSGISNGSKNLNIIKELFSKNYTGIKDIDIDSIYQSYKYIIFNTKFLVTIIDKLQQKDILELSIICNYYDKY